MEKYLFHWQIIHLTRKKYSVILRWKKKLRVPLVISKFSSGPSQKPFQSFRDDEDKPQWTETAIVLKNSNQLWPKLIPNHDKYSKSKSLLTRVDVTFSEWMCKVGFVSSWQATELYNKKKKKIKKEEKKKRKLLSWGGRRTAVNASDFFYIHTLRVHYTVYSIEALAVDGLRRARSGGAKTVLYLCRKHWLPRKI